MAAKEEEGMLSSLKPHMAVTGTTLVSAIVQTFFGLMAFIYILKSTVAVPPAVTYQSPINPFTIILVFSITLGLLWGFLVYLWFAHKDKMTNRLVSFGSFLTYYTFFYVMWVAWYSYWIDISGGSHAIAPRPGTIGFISYAGLQMFVIFGTVFFDVYAWRLAYSDPDNTFVTGAAITVNISQNTSILWMTILSVFACVAGMVPAFWGYLTVLGYNMGALWIPLIAYIVYMGCEIFAFLLYAVSYRYRTKQESGVSGGFAKHWREMDSVFVFLSFVFFVNLGFAIQFWGNLTNGQLNSGVHFPNNPQYYWVIIMFGVFNAICTPVFMYYFVTILCMAPWLQGKELKSTTALPEEETFLGTLGKPFWGVSVNVLAAVSSKTNKSFKLEAGSTWLKIIFLMFLYLGLIYQFLLFFFTFYDLLHTHRTYTSTVYYAWYITALVIQCVFWFVYTVYALATVWLARQESNTSVSEKVFATANSFLYCQLFRPVATFAIVVFLETFAYAEIFRFRTPGTNEMPQALIADPTNILYMVYNGTYIIILGLVFAAIMSFKDMISSVNSTTVTSNATLTISYEDKQGNRVTETVSENL